MKLLTCVVVLLCTITTYGSNLLSNGGFESGVWTSDKTGTWGLDVDAVEGTYSLNAVSSTIKAECSSGIVAVNRDAVYRLSAWIKTADVDSATGVSIKILQCTASNQAIGWLDNQTLIAAGGHKGWRYYEYTVDNIHANCAYFKIYLKLNANAGGEVLFDDLKLEAVSKITNFHFDESAWNYEKGGGGWTWDDVNPNNGAGCMYSAPNPTVTRYNSTSLIAVDPTQIYSMSAFIKTDSVVADHGVEIRILQCNSSNQAIGWYVPEGTSDAYVFSQSGTQGYTGYILDNISFNANAINVKIYVRHNANSGGSAYVDDIQLIAHHRDNFNWGVSAHSPALSSSYSSNLSDCMELADDTNCNLYRVDFTLQKDAGGNIIWSWSDAVVDEAYSQGRAVYAILYCQSGGTYQQIYDDTYAFVERYKGKVDFYQLLNEVDCRVILGAQYDGMSTSHYNMTSFAIWSNALDAMSNAVNDADPDVKRVINISWKHVGFLELLEDAGVEWDVNGVDWYWGVTFHLTDTVDALLDIGKEIIVAESNIDRGTYDNTEEEAAEMLLDHAEYFYNHSSPLMIGYVAYELLDEPRHSTPAQQCYGLYNADGYGDIGLIKESGTAYADFISVRK